MAGMGMNMVWVLLDWCQALLRCTLFSEHCLLGMDFAFAFVWLGLDRMFNFVLSLYDVRLSLPRGFQMNGIASVYDQSK
jgi:hypothetical protein